MEAFCLGFPSIQAKTCRFPRLWNSSVQSLKRYESPQRSLLLSSGSNRCFAAFYRKPQFNANRYFLTRCSVVETAGDRNSTKKPQRRRKKKISPSFNEDGVLEGPRRTGNAVANKDFVNKEVLYQNGDPLGRRELGKHVVRWIAQGMTAMAADFCAAEERGEVGELEKKIRSGIEFVMQAQPYLVVNPMPRGLEAVCLKASTHYPTLFDNFQRELRNKLQALQTQKAVIQDWKETESWRLLKQLTKSGFSPLAFPFIKAEMFFWL